jgi:hypothetical protein
LIKLGGKFYLYKNINGFNNEFLIPLRSSRSGGTFMEGLGKRISIGG